jgi:ATP-dependent Clp protease adapter protein ClpS
MIAKTLEAYLQSAFDNARQLRHERVTVEHLLLALLDDPTVSEVLRACFADIDDLRKRLDECVTEHTSVSTEEDVNSQPTIDFQRAIQRAIQRVQSSGKKEVRGADVLVAILGEKDSQAAKILGQQGIMWLNVVDYLAHGFRKEQNVTDTLPDDGSDVRVVLYNDDYTPMDFVVSVLQEFFAMDRKEATEAMLEVHRQGKTVCGLYSIEDGKTVVEQVLAHAHKHGYPLRCAIVGQ